MTEIVGVRFKELGKIYSFDPDGNQYSSGTNVIVETSRGIEFGEVINGNYEIEDEQVIAPLRKVIREATPEDLDIVLKNREKEQEALKICQKKILEHKLEMKAIDVECTFDRSKILFYFTADGRIDFRELVRDLASVFKTRIELRQVGVRDEAKMLGGLGICGRPFCCATFLDDFQPVSIKMAKEQSLSLNPTKISGTCGRLMCCLKYEQEAYEELHRTTPRVDSLVDTPQGLGTVVDVSLLSGNLKVRLNEGNDLTPKCFHKCEVCIKRKPYGGKGKHADVVDNKPESEAENKLTEEPIKNDKGLEDEMKDQAKDTPKPARRRRPRKPVNNEDKHEQPPREGNHPQNRGHHRDYKNRPPKRDGNHLTDNTSKE